MIMIFIFLVLFVWFTRLAMLAADNFVGELSSRKTILTILEIMVFFPIVFFTINNRFSIEQTILNFIQYG